MALWLIAGLRLLVPVTAASPLCIWGLLKPAQYSAVSRLVLYSVSSVRPAPHGLETVPERCAVFAENSFLENVLPAVWLIVFLFLAIFFSVSYRCCKRKFKMSLPVKTLFTDSWLKQHSLFRSLTVRVSDRITSPLTYGIVRPVILLPKSVNLKDEEKLNYILTHEYMHIRRFDAASKLLLTALLCIHWFNPLVWIFCHLAARDMELSCDEAVVRSLGPDGRRAYALVLIHMEARKSRLPSLFNCFSKNNTEERIKTIMKYKKSSVVTLTAAVVIIVVLAAAFATKLPSKTVQSQDIPKKAADNQPLRQSTLYSTSTDGESYWLTFDAKTNEWAVGSLEKRNGTEPSYYTADEYKDLIEKEKKLLASMLDGSNDLVYFSVSEDDSKVSVPETETFQQFFSFQKEDADKIIADMEETLKRIENGEHVEKPALSDFSV